MAEKHDAKLYFKYYRRIYFTLLTLLAVSVVGPLFGITWITLLTAFGIALVKADMVIESFMHLRVEKRIIKWMLASSLVVMGLFFWGVAPDVMNHEGLNWENVAAQAAVARGITGEGAEGPEADVEPAGGAATTASAFNAAAAYRNACAPCHGDSGAGDGLAGAALDPEPADFTAGAFWEGRTDTQLVGAIRGGGVAVGRSPLMPPWGGMFDAAQAQAIADHLRTFRPGP
jgi:caa(3)-type oxidase subunit IV